jgi:hypothetical protein
MNIQTLGEQTGRRSGGFLLPVAAFCSPATSSASWGERRMRFDAANILEDVYGSINTVSNHPAIED